MNEYRYTVVANNDPANSIGDELLENLNQGFEIISAVPTQGAVHYVLQLVPQRPPVQEPLHTDKDAPPKIDDDTPDEPINLDDIPF